jgi:hypothetical protein
MAESTGLALHEDVPLFREAVNFTASKTGFNPRLIEKDYFCTVLLILPPLSDGSADTGRLSES